MSFKLGYRPELDGLRAIAVISIMLGHSSLLAKGADLLSPGASFPTLLRGGVFGVDIFFVLSGFLITALLLIEHSTFGRIDFKAFYIRRVLRLLPAMFLLLLGCLIYVLLLRPEGSQFGFRAILSAAFYISNFVFIRHGNLLGMLTPTWSLSVEEQFYSLWPLVLLICLRLKRQRMFHFILLGAVCAALLRARLYGLSVKTGHSMLGAVADRLLLARADSLLCGALAAMTVCWQLYSPQKHLTSWRIAGWISGLLLGVMLCLARSYGASLFYYTYACASVLTAILIVALITAPPPLLRVVLTFPPLVYTGRISYGLYLFHVPVYCLMPATVPALLLPIGGGNAYIMYIVSVITAFLIASASYYLIERKFLKLKHRLYAPRIESTLASPHQQAHIIV